MAASSTTPIAQADAHATAGLAALNKRTVSQCRHYRLRSSTRAKALPRVGFAARIRKDRSNPDRTARAASSAPKFIAGFAIKTRANRLCFSELQISNRR